MLITSSLLLMVAIIFIRKGNNNTIGTALLMTVMLLNVIRGLINVWNKRRVNKATKINLILLASGDSIRFKGNKLLTEVNDKSMYMNVVEKALKLKFRFNKIILVTQYEEIKAALVEQPIQVVMNKNSELGISNSIKLGISEDMEADAYMFMVCDQPFISLESMEKLIDSFMKSNKGMACVQYEGKLGNPTVFSEKYKDELLGLEGDVGGKYIMKKHLDDLEKIQISHKLELMDIDTREELEKLR